MKRSKGRIGPLLWDKRYFRSLCSEHHRLAHEKPKLAKRLGISLSRLGVMEEEEGTPE